MMVGLGVGIESLEGREGEQWRDGSRDIWCGVKSVGGREGEQWWDARGGTWRDVGRAHGFSLLKRIPTGGLQCFVFILQDASGN